MTIQARLITPRATGLIAVTIPKSPMSAAPAIKEFLETKVLPDGFTVEVVPESYDDRRIKRVLVREDVTPTKKPMKIPAGRVLLSIPDKGIVSFASTYLVREVFQTLDTHTEGLSDGN